MHATARHLQLKQVIASAATIRYAPADGISTLAKIAADLRPSADGPQSAHLWWPAMAKLQAASVPTPLTAAPWDRQTDGSRYSKMSH